MNSSKLVDIFKNGHIVIPIYFLKKYSEWNLDMKEFVFLMYLYHLGDKFLFDPNKFSEDLNMGLADVMNYIDNLTEKGFIRVEVLKNDKGLMEEDVLLDDFYQKISFITMDEVNQSKTENSNIYELIEKEFGRTLSPIEYEIIKAWLDHHIKEEVIREAVKEATFNGVSNLRYIDKILYEWGKAGIDSVEDIEKMRTKRNKKAEKEEDIDLGIVDWNWFDEDE